MAKKHNWEVFFDAHAPIYDQQVYTTNTVREVEFLIDELQLLPGSKVLDIGCGTGRHSIELAKRGCAVTGLDLSSEMLLRADAAAKAANVSVRWIRGNATLFEIPECFDAAICLCEGAFGLLSQDDDPIDQPLSILCNVSRSLKAEGRTLFTVLNGAALFRKHQNVDVSEGRFDPLTMVEFSAVRPQDELPAVAVRERGFIPTELRLLFRMAGLSVTDMWGGTAGNWGRRGLDLDEIEIMVVARKSSEP
jgi:SAM-dependent methyltransferase